MNAVLRGHIDTSAARKPGTRRIVYPSPESEDKRRREKWLVQRIFHRESKEADKERSRETQVAIRDARKL